MKKRATDKILSLILVLAMTLTVMPMITGAVEIEAPSDAYPIVNATSTGTEGRVYYDGDLYRVTENSGTTMTLFMDGSIGNMQYDSSANDGWSSSDICGYLNTTFLSEFSAAEQNAMVTGYGTDSESYDYGAIDSRQTIVLPSASEVKDGGTWNLSQTDREFSNGWWLRTPGVDGSSAAFVSDAGDVDASGGSVSTSQAIRPAFKLNLASILLASAASGGKSVAINSTLEAVAEPTGAVKLTVIDDANLELDIIDASPRSGNQGDTIEIEFDNAEYGTGRSVSMLLCDTSGNMVCYGRLVDCTYATGGTARFIVPLELSAGSYIVKIFNEEVNSDYLTDYASTPVEINLTVTDNTAPTVSGVAPAGAGSEINGDITINFSEAMNITPGMVSLNNGGTVNTHGSWSNSNKTYIVSYSGLDWDTEYAVTIEGFEDAAGNVMLTDNIHTFTTMQQQDGPYVSMNILTVPVGQTRTFVVSLGQSGNKAASATVTSNNTRVATVAPSSLNIDGIVMVTGVSAGNTAITIGFSGGDLLSPVVKTITVTTTHTSGKSRGNNSSSAAPVITAPATYWLTKSEVAAIVMTARNNFASHARSRRSGPTGVRAGDFAALAGREYQHDTMDGNTVQVRVYIKNPGIVKKDLMVSGYVKGGETDRIRTLFEKYFTNGVRCIHLDQKEDWGQPVGIAAKVDLTGMNIDNLHFCSYNAEGNTYRLIPSSNYWIDTNGYLRFTTTHAGDIIISEGALKKK